MYGREEIVSAFRVKTMAAGLAFMAAGGSEASAQVVRNVEFVEPAKLIQQFRDGPASAVPAIAGAPVGTRRHQFRLNAATLYSESSILAQPAVLTVAFDMEPVPNVNNGRKISNVQFTLEVQAGGNIPMPAYTLRTLGPESPTDFFPPDPTWWHGGHAYSEESFWKDETYFHIELPANIELRAAGTVLDSAIKRLDDGRAYGGQALLKLYPYCTRDLKTCRPGALTGISFSKWGLGWVDRLYPDFRLISEETFSLASEPSAAAAGRQ